MKYYGVRYATGCHPDDLWKSYFTSSKFVAEYRQRYGEPDIIQIRHTFSNAQKARTWEYNVLRRIGAAVRTDYLNKIDKGENFIGGVWAKGKTYEEMYGKERADQLKEIRRNAIQTAEMSRLSSLQNHRKGRKKENHPLWNRGHTNETKLKISQGRIGKLNPRYDPTIHTFSHNQHGIFIGTRCDLVHAFPEQRLHTGCLKHLCSGKVKQHRGWFIPQTTPSSSLVENSPQV